MVEAEVFGVRREVDGQLDWEVACALEREKGPEEDSGWVDAAIPEGARDNATLVDVDGGPEESFIDYELSPLVAYAEENETHVAMEVQVIIG